MDYRLGRLKGQFVVVWEEGGKRRRFRLGALTPVEARAALLEFVRRRHENPVSASKRIIAEIYADYVAEREEEGKVSAPRMRDAWKRLSPDFAHVMPDDCVPSMVRAYTNKRRAQGASDGTIHVELGYLRAALRRSLKGKTPDIKLPSKPRPRDRYLTPDEARRLIDAAQMPHVRLFILLALHTAGRPSSILDLEWNRVDLLRGVINLDNPSRDRTAKGRATVPIDGVLASALQRAREGALTGYVIEWSGRPVRSIKKGVSQAAKRAGLQGVTPYVLRHTACVWMAEAGIPLAEIAAYMGHTSPAITFRVYARYSPKHLTGAADAISTALYGSNDRKT